MQKTQTGEIDRLTAARTDCVFAWPTFAGGGGIIISTPVQVTESGIIRFGKLNRDSLL